MGNIVGDPLNENVKKQINIRQSKLGKINRNNEDLLFYNSKTAWLRLASSINVDETADVFKSILNLTSKGNDGSELAKKCVLFGGMSSFNNDNNGTNSLRFGINTDPNDILNTGAYGFGGSLDKYGFSPMPGLVGANVSFYNRGALKKATIQLKVFNPIQLQIIDTLYLRIGYTMLLEWGWSLYFNKDGKLEPSDYKTEPFELLFDKTKITQNTEKSTQNTKNDSYQNLLLESIKKERETRSYNYDAMFGKVSNFNWKFNDDGSYDIEITLIGLGDVVEALKTNISTGTGKVNDLASNAQARLNQIQNTLSAKEGAQNKLLEEFNNLITQDNVQILEKFTKEEVTYDQGSILLNVKEGLDKFFGFKDRRFIIKKQTSQWLQNPIFISYLTTQKLNIGDISSGYTPDKKNEIDKIISALEDVSRIQLLNPTYFEEKNYRKFSILNELANNYLTNKDINKSFFTKIIQPKISKSSDYNYNDILNEFNTNILNIDKDVIDDPQRNLLNLSEVKSRYFYYNIFNELLNQQYNSDPDYYILIGSDGLNDIYKDYPLDHNSRNKINNYEGSLILYNDINTYISKLRRIKGELDRLDISLSNKENDILNAQKDLERAEIIGGQSYIKYANTTLMNKFLYYNIYEPLSKKSQSKPFPLETNKNSVLSPVDIKAINDLYPKSIIKYNFKTKGNLNKSIDYSQYYIKLGALLKVVELKLLLYNSDGPSGKTEISKDGDPKSSVKADPLFTFDIDKDTYCLSYSRQKSADPLICIIPYKSKDLNINFLPNDKFRVNDNDNVGRPLEIYVNINHIANCVLNNLDKDGGVNLLSFLRALLSGVNDALGNINKLDAIYDDETNKVKILEESNLDNPDNPSTPNKKDSPEDFRIYGVDKGNLKGSFITNVDFTVTLPPNMAAMATISAQASGIIVGEGATALSNLNNGLKDRVIPEKSDAQSISESQKIKSKITENIIKQIKENKNTSNLPDFIKKSVDKFIKNNKIDPNNINTDSLIALLRSDPDIILAQQINAALQYTQEIYRNFIITQENIDSFKTANRDLSLHNISANSLNIPGVKPFIPAPFFIPFNLSLTMDGLAGMVNYQRFTITKDILPYQYSANKIDFIIKGITHDIKDNYWTTQIESISVGAKTK